MRSGGRVVEGARLESEYTAKPDRGFESLPLRQFFPSDRDSCNLLAAGCPISCRREWRTRTRCEGRGPSPCAEAHKNKMRGSQTLALPFVMQGPCFRRLLDEARPCGFGFLLGRTRSSLRTFL